MNVTFGEKIKTARKTMGLTQKQLADMIGAKHNSISDWEKGKNKPDSNTIEALCRALNMTPNYLLGARSEDAFSPAEKQLIAKYRKLDAFGRELIDTILEKTYAHQFGVGQTSLTVQVSPEFPAAENGSLAQQPAEDMGISGEPMVDKKPVEIEPVPLVVEEPVSIEPVVIKPEILPDEEPLPDQIPVEASPDQITLEDLMEKEAAASDIPGQSYPDYEELPVPVQHVPEESAEPETRVLAYYKKLELSMFDRFTLDALPDATMEITVTPENDDADFIVQIHGDSMEPTFCDGDNLLVEETDVVGVGDIGVFFADGECHIKETGAYGLISHNPRYALIPGTSSIRCVGRVLGKVD